MQFSKFSKKCLASLVDFHSVVLDFKLFNQYIPNEMISKKKNFNIEKPRNGHLLQKIF